MTKTKNIFYKCSYPDEKCNLSYLGEYSRCLENRTKEHNSHITSAIYQHSISNNHLRANISHLKILDQYSKQVATEAREAIHIRINNPALKCNTGKMYIQEIFNNLFGADGSTHESHQMADSDHPQGHIILTVPSNSLPEQCVWQIKYPEHYYSLNWHPTLSPIAKWWNILLQSSNLILGAKEVLCTSKICLWISSHTFNRFEAPKWQHSSCISW